MVGAQNLSRCLWSFAVRSILLRCAGNLHRAWNYSGQGSPLWCLFRSCGWNFSKMLDPNAQCFLLHISHRNRVLSTSNCPPPSPQRGETRPHKPVNGRQERGGIRHAWQIFIKASLDEVHMGCASMSSMEHIQNQRIHLLKYNVRLFLSFKLVGM